MNKKLIVAAIAAAVMVPGMASAAKHGSSATLYGIGHVSLDHFDNSDWEVRSRASRLGVKGKEDLGDGLAAIYQMEFNIDISNNVQCGAGGTTDCSGGRDAFVGLTGGFGTFVMGTHATPAKMAFYAAGTETIGDSLIDLNGMGAFVETRAENAVAYVTPNMSGFQAAIAATPNGPRGAGDGDFNDAISVGAWYKSGAFKVSAGYETVDQSATATTAADTELFQIGGSFSGDNFTVGAHYQATQNNNAASNVDESDSMAVTGKFSFGQNAVRGIIANIDNEGAGDDTNWGASFEHNFSKRTTAYVAINNNDVARGGSGDKGTNFSGGIRHKF